jgi:hypothetical protein
MITLEYAVSAKCEMSVSDFIFAGDTVGFASVNSTAKGYTVLFFSGRGLEFMERWKRM